MGLGLWWRYTDDIQACVCRGALFATPQGLDFVYLHVKLHGAADSRGCYIMLVLQYNHQTKH